MERRFEGEGGLRPRPVYNEVGFARSTWRKAKEFQEGIHALSQRMPLIAARTFLVSGIKDDAVSDALYDEVDRLQALRREGIASEMRYVGAQAFVRFKKFPEEASYLVREYGPKGFGQRDVEESIERAIQEDEARENSWSSCARLLLGDDVLSGADIRFGFSNELYAMMPSLKVYEYFMWFDLAEVED